MKHRCPYCAHPSNPCRDCEARFWGRDLDLERFEQAQDAAASEPPRVTLLVWFEMPETLARQHLTRLLAEWPHAYEVIEPELPGDLVGVRLSRNERDLGAGPTVELDVTESRVMRSEEPFRALFER